MPQELERPDLAGEGFIVQGVYQEKDIGTQNGIVVFLHAHPALHFPLHDRLYLPVEAVFHVIKHRICLAQKEFSAGKQADECIHVGLFALQYLLESQIITTERFPVLKDEMTVFKLDRDPIHQGKRLPEFIHGYAPKVFGMHFILVRPEQ